MAIEGVGNFAYRKMRNVALIKYGRNPYNGIINLEAQMNNSPFLSMNRSCEEALSWSKEQLSQARLRPVQTFDLHTARAGLHDCSCPNHGMEDCDCQMVVMLVYGEADEPVTLILHGNDGQTWFSIADGPGQKTDNQLRTAIQQALEVKVPEPDDL